MKKKDETRRASREEEDIRAIREKWSNYSNIRATAKPCNAFVVLQDEFYSVWYIVAHSSYADVEEVKKAISIEVFKDSVKYRTSN